MLAAPKNTASSLCCYSLSQLLILSKPISTSLTDNTSSSYLSILAFTFISTEPSITMSLMGGSSEMSIYIWTAMLALTLPFLSISNMGILMPFNYSLVFLYPKPNKTLNSLSPPNLSTNSGIIGFKSSSLNSLCQSLL